MMWSKDIIACTVQLTPLAEGLAIAVTAFVAGLFARSAIILAFSR